MDVQQFLAEFGHIANAPGGIGKLRELILELAIRGELLATSDRATNAGTLLSEIDSFRKEQVGAGKLRRPTPQPEIEDSELTFKLPENWAFERLGNVCEIVRGVTFPSSKKQTSRSSGVVACLRTSNVQAEIDWDDLIFIEPELVGRADQWVEKGDTMISMANSYELVGKVALVREVKERATFGGFIAAVRPHVLEPDYLYLVLRSPYMQARMRITASQTTNIANISLGGMRPIPTPIPPKEEQSRIVAKVDELMALCDKLEAQQQARRKLQNNLRHSTLQAVASATNPHELQTTWARLADNFGRLFHAPEDVADLRQVILDLAFTGNISEQPESVTSNLVESLHLRKMQLSAEKRIKRETPVIDFPGIAEMLGSIPDQWAWVRLNDIASVVRGGSPRPAGNPKFYGGSIPFLKVADVTAAKGMFVERFTSTITEAGLNKTREISTRTVLLTNSGATLGVPAICEFRTTFNDGIAAFIELNDAVFDEYLYLFLKSKTKWLQDIASRGQGQPNLNTEIIRSMWFPLAPISEQHRIVTRVSELMRFCDVLEANLKHVSVVGRRLAVAVVSSLTGIAIEQEEEPMKAPQTELIAPLRLGTAPDIKAQAPLATILARHHGEMSAKDLWQRFGGEIDAFYAQLKTEVAHGWILEPAPAEMREKLADAVSA